jgi:hypothetical protein
MRYGFNDSVLFGEGGPDHHDGYVTRRPLFTPLVVSIHTLKFGSALDCLPFVAVFEMGCMSEDCTIDI